MIVPEACCCNPALKSGYEPTGSWEQFGDDLKVYTVGPKDAKTTIILIYDIFGIHNNTLQFCDILSKAGHRVFMPDIFRGEQLPEESLGDRAKLLAWVAKNGSNERCAKDLETLYAGATHAKMGIVGFCWGARVALNAAIEQKDAERFSALALVHPSMIDPIEDFKNIKAPVCFLPSKNEPDYLPAFEFVSKQPFGNKSVHHRFDDMPHGFCGARGDFADKVNLERAQEAVDLLSKFFKDTLLH